jgi:hypothetical protein
MIADLWTKIQTGYLPHTGVERYSYTNLLDVLMTGWVGTVVTKE